jgi:hypothetical protein
MSIYTNGIVYGMRIAKYIDDRNEENIMLERKDVAELALKN